MTRQDEQWIVQQSRQKNVVPPAFLNMKHPFLVVRSNYSYIKTILPIRRHLRRSQTKYSRQNCLLDALNWLRNDISTMGCRVHTTPNIPFDVFHSIEPNQVATSSLSKRALTSSVHSSPSISPLSSLSAATRSVWSSSSVTVPSRPF